MLNKSIDQILLQINFAEKRRFSNWLEHRSNFVKCSRSFWCAHFSNFALHYQRKFAAFKQLYNFCLKCTLILLELRHCNESNEPKLKKKKTNKKPIT